MMNMNIGMGMGGGGRRAGVRIDREERDSTPFTSIVIFVSVVASAVLGSSGGNWSSGGNGGNGGNGAPGPVRRVYVFPSLELVLFCGVIYHLRAIERSIGSRKAAGVCAVSGAVYACLCVCAGYVPWASVLAHWYAAALCVYYAADVPSAFTFRVVGNVRFGSNVLVYLTCALCVGLCMPEGAVGAAAGVVAGLLCRTRVVSECVDRVCCAARGKNNEFRDCYVGLVREGRRANNNNANNNNDNNDNDNNDNNVNVNAFMMNNNNNTNVNRNLNGNGMWNVEDREATLRRLRVEADPAKVRELVGMGFDEASARNALSMCDNNVEAAVNRILGYN